MKTPRTKKELLADPRVAKIGEALINTERDILWQEDDGWGFTDAEMDRPSYWLSLSEEWESDNGTVTLHAKTIKDLCDELTLCRKRTA